jgi:hypothetical protein
MGEGPFPGAETLVQGVFVLPFVGGSECVLMAKVPQSTWDAMTRNGPLSFYNVNKYLKWGFFMGYNLVLMFCIAVSSGRAIQRCASHHR